MTNNQDYINITNKEELNLQMCRPEGTLFFYIDNLTKDEEISADEIAENMANLGI